jgi:hypothetical protein
MSNPIELAEYGTLAVRSEKAMQSIMQKATAFAVVDEQTYLDADEIIKAIRVKVEERKAELLPPKEAATETWKRMCALVKKYIDDPLEACKTLDRKRYAWKKAEDRRREEEAEVARKAEQKKIDDERAKVAKNLEAAGLPEQAAEVRNAPVAPSVAQAAPVAKPVGQSNLENWQAEVTDADKVPREFCTPDLSKLNKYAKLMKGKASVPGVTFTDVGTVRRTS